MSKRKKAKDKDTLADSMASSENTAPEAQNAASEAHPELRADSQPASATDRSPVIELEQAADAFTIDDSSAMELSSSAGSGDPLVDSVNAGESLTAENAETTDSSDESEEANLDLEEALREWSLDAADEDAVSAESALTATEADDSDENLDSEEEADDEVSSDEGEREIESPARPQVTFISDPFHLTTHEVAAAQGNDEFEPEEDFNDEELEAESAEPSENVSAEADAISDAFSAAMGAADVTETTDAPNVMSTEGLITDAEDAPEAETAEADDFEDGEDTVSDFDDKETELQLNDNEEEVSDTLKALEGRLQSQAAADQQLAEEAAMTQAKVEADAKTLLEAQIREDQELERAMKEEAEQNIETDPELLAALPKTPEEDENGNLDLSELQSCIETLLFMVDKPLSTKKLHELLGPEMNVDLFQQALSQMKDRYQKLHHGFELVEVAGGYQFRSKPVRAALAKKLAKIQTQRLSTGAMEVLAIVAYKQPVMKEDVDKIRGVDSSHFIRGLLDKKLIKISGRSELPGRPMLYTTSNEFMEVFGLKGLEDLPPLREIESMVPGSQGGNDEDPRVKTLRALVGEMKADTSVSLLYDPKEDEKFLSDIRSKVSEISVTTPTLAAAAEEKKAREKALKEGLTTPEALANADAMNAVSEGETPEFPSLNGDTPEVPPAAPESPDQNLNP